MPIIDRTHGRRCAEPGRLATIGAFGLLFQDYALKGFDFEPGISLPLWIVFAVGLVVLLLTSPPVARRFAENTCRLDAYNREVERTNRENQRRVDEYNRKADRHNDAVIADLNRQLRAASSGPRYTASEESLGLVSYTSNPGYAGQDFFGYRLTTNCGAASCQSAEATFELQVLDPQQGPPGADGAPGTPGKDGAPGAPGSVVTVDRLFIASYLDGLTARRGKPVILRYVSTTSAQVMLEVFKGARRVSAAVGTARPGKNSIRWNGKVDGKKAPRGLYKLRLKATSGEQVATDRAAVRLR